MSARPIANVALALGALAFSLLIIEAGLLALAGAGANDAKGSVYRYDDLYVSDQPIAVFERVAGYRRTPGPTRFLRIVHDEVVYDRVFTPNNAGYISARDYAHDKPLETTRLVVFGDSFTSAEFNAMPWPDTVHTALQGKTERPTELYSFAVNGGGLGSWHSIFFEDILPHYQFDALVIATYGDDLARGYSYLHYDGVTPYAGYFPTRAASDEDFFANYLPRMARHGAIVASAAQIDEMIASLHAAWRWPGLKIRSVPLLVAQWDRIRTGKVTAPAAVAVEVPAAPEHNAIDIAAIEARYGSEAFGRLGDILTYCKEHGIPVVLASVPGRDGARAVAQSRGQLETPHQQETRVIAEHFGALYMDGYAPFADVPPEDIDGRYWLKYDGHWNQAGSDRFAAAMTEFLMKEQSRLRRRAALTAP
jgi:hypothetical protein